MKGILFSLVFLAVFIVSIEAQQSLVGSLNVTKSVFDEDTHFEEFSKVLDENKAIEMFRNIVTENKTNIGRRVVSSSIQKGWFTLAQYLILNYFRPKGIDLHETFVVARKKLKLDYIEKFEKLASFLPKDSDYLGIINPCYLWGQNMTHILLKIKFTPKIDVPGFLEVMNLNITIIVDMFYLTAFTYTSEVPIKFELEIKGWRHFNPNSYRHEQTEMGTVFIEILKSPSPYFWENLHLDVFHNPPNQYFWWDMYYRYKEQLHDALGLLVKIDDFRDNNEEKQQEKEDGMQESRRIISNRKKVEKESEKTDLRNRQYCWDLAYEKKCLIPSPFEWHMWFYD